MEYVGCCIPARHQDATVVATLERGTISTMPRLGAGRVQRHHAWADVTWAVA
jgi:hypothetical protein